MAGVRAEKAVFGFRGIQQFALQRKQ